MVSGEVSVSPSPGAGASGPVLVTLTFATFGGAFLLFLVQPMVARMVLPWFGGSAAVWTVAMLFFQLLLLAGYLYAHATRRLPRNRFLALHLTLLALSLLALPLWPGARWKPTGAEDPTLLLLGLLTATVGFPYFLLATTGPLMQARLHSTGAGEKMPGGPYRLYAVSNLASLLALLGYPIVVEPTLTTRAQGGLWSVGYGVFVLLSGAALYLTSRGAAGSGDETAARKEEKPKNEPGRLGPGKRSGPRPEGSGTAASTGKADPVLTWFLLSAAAVTLLLGITNRICRDVAAVPFLWILPLTLYLASFILCFDARGWYRRSLFLGLLPFVIAAMGYVLVATGLGEKAAIAILSAGLFLCCMVCHGELHRLRPHPDRLTGFYLAISAGGAAGGLFVALLAPHLFVEYDEAPLGLVFLGILVLVSLRRDPGSRALLARWRLDWLLAIAALFVFASLVDYQVKRSARFSAVRMRNFYGSVRVVDRMAGSLRIRRMSHGTTNHGEQFLDPRLRRSPTTYFSPVSGVGRAIAYLLSPGAPPRHVGIIGLGAGTLAAYGRPGDRFRFYEINPLVPVLARTEFTYLSDSQAAIAVVLGDGRLSLEREAPQRFDILVVDAFSGDSIPVHLLTVEAFAEYQRHLAPGGLLAVHVSNHFLDLAPIVALAARSRGLDARLIESPEIPRRAVTEASWMLLSPETRLFDDPVFQGSARPVVPPVSLRTWTDDYSNLLRSIK